MRVVVEASAGQERRRVLGPGDSVCVGRDAAKGAEWVFPNDQTMSGRHFQFEVEAQHCFVSDLGSRNKTRVNGAVIQRRTALSDGARVRAGQTDFAVRIELGASAAAAPGGDLDTIRPATAPAIAAPAPVPPTREIPPERREPAAATAPTHGGVPPELWPLMSSGRLRKPPRPPAHYTRERCDSGLTLYRGRVDELHPADLAVQLADPLPVHLVVNFALLGCPPPEELAARDYLFDWLEPAVRNVASPLVLGQGDFIGWPDLLRAGWGKDAIVCLFSRMEKRSVLDHLRSACRQRDRGEGGAAIVGLSWPSVLAPLLAMSSPQAAQTLMAGIEAVLVELPDLPETWQLYGGPDLGQTLDRSGLVLSRGA